MSIKKGDDGSRRVEMTVDVAGTPEEVWAAMATGPGISCWFTPTRVEERVGGMIAFELGPDMESVGQITTWEPPGRLGYEERDWMEGAPPLATEVRIEIKEGGTCVVRMVHSLFASSENWDDQLESMENGWPPFLTILQEYMKHYRSLTCTPVRLLAKSSEPEAQTWARLQSAFGLESLAIDQPFQSLASAELCLGGSVMQLGTTECPHQAMLRLEQPGQGFVTMGAFTWGGEVLASATFYFYGDRDSAMAHDRQDAWTAWFANLFS